jgi:putative hemolysin
MNEATPRLFSLGNAPTAGTVMSSLWKLVEQPVERLLSLDAMNDIYQRTQQVDSLGASYFASILEVMKISYQVSDEDRQKLPTSGPVLVVANHPFGAAEGVILGDLLTRVRPDARLMGNHLLHRVPELRPWIVPVDPFGGAGAVRNNVGPLKTSLRWLKEGGALGVFPAGAVSHLRVREGRVVDPAWHASVAALARRSGATVVPVFFEGRNSALFHLAGLVHAGLRTALIPSELVKRAHSRVAVRIGRPIGPDKLARHQDDATLISYLRWKTYMLSRRESPIRPRFAPRARPAAVEPIAAAPALSALIDEIARLPDQARLIRQNDFEVFISPAGAIPNLLREIGRQREIAFRAVSEGTGRAVDLDRHDDDYLHLVMWNHAAQEIVGSYRIGQVDAILDKSGLAGLYTSTLFKFQPGFLERLGPSLELGRSFIRAEYQRKPTSLALLWRGIGEFIVRHPRYKVLFGPVSISRDYQSLSRRIMVDALSRQRGDEALATLVKARNPPRDKLSRDDRQIVDSIVKDVDDISTLVAEIEADNKGMPVLLRHYLRLGARLLSFNVDPAFGNCIDGLIVVDLRASDDKLIGRFMGQEGLRRFRAAG